MADVFVACAFIESAFAATSPVSRKKHFGQAGLRLRGRVGTLDKVRDTVRSLRLTVDDGTSADGIYWTGKLVYDDAHEFVRQAQRAELLPAGPLPLAVAYDRQGGDAHLLDLVMYMTGLAGDILAGLQGGVQREIDTMNSPTEPWGQPEPGYTPLPMLVLRALTALQKLHLYWSTTILLRTESLRRDKGQPSLLERA